VRKVFVVLSGLLLLAVVLQFYFAATGTFDRPQDDDSFAAHGTNALIILILSLLTTISAALARAGGRTIGLAALPILLVVLQIVIFIVADLFVPAGTPRDADDVPLEVGGPALYTIGLHAINGLAILLTAAVIFRRARALDRSTPATPAPVSTDVPVG
jgi:uncharacterized membrane protein